MASIRNCTGPLAVLLSLPFLLGADQKAKTENGREVILHDDGTWTYLKAPKPDKKTGAGNEFKKDKQAVLQYKSRRGTFALHLIPGAWRKADKPVNPSAEVQFTHADGDVMAMVIAERITMPLDTLKEAAIAHWKRGDNDVKVTRDEKRVVNGKEVLALTAEINMKGIAMTFYCYYYSGAEGSIQLLTWTGRNLFKEMEPDMEAFLNGFEVLKK